MTQIALFENDTPQQPAAWQADRSSGLEQLKAFVPRAGRAYAQSRNSDFGAGKHTNVSVLSPWLRHRLVLEEEVILEALKHHSLSTAEKFIQEVFWRAYFKGWMEHRPQVWRVYRQDVLGLLQNLNTDPDLSQRYEAATNGTTGIDCMDAWAQELVSTGYLHNHARMWFASIWIFTLRLPWQLGADFFYRHLMDGDPASNTLSWRWVAGLHTKGKHYLARADNIERFTAGRFRPTGLVKDAAPIVENHDYLPSPIEWPSATQDSKRFGLLVTEEDMYVESLSIRGKPASVLGLLATDKRSPLDVGKHASAFAKQGMANAVSRASDHFQCESQTGDSDWASALIEWAQSHGLNSIVTAHLPAGPVQEQLTKASPQLKSAGVQLFQIPRPYDQTCWRYADKGFFKLKKKMPELIQELII